MKNENEDRVDLTNKKIENNNTYNERATDISDE